MATMTLDEVMKLEGRDLDLAVAERLGLVLFTDYAECPSYVEGAKWQGDYYAIEVQYAVPQERFDQDDYGEGDELKLYSSDWSAAMQVREWARGLGPDRAIAFVRDLRTVIERRLNAKYSYESALMLASPIDYARAALLVSP